MNDPLQFPETVPIVGNKFTIGRGRGNDLILPDMSISRMHCVLEKDEVEDKWFITDSSSNGILLNGNRIQKKTKISLENNCYLSLTDKIFYVFEIIPVDYGDVASSVTTRLRKTTRQFDEQDVIDLCNDTVRENTAASKPVPPEQNKPCPPPKDQSASQENPPASAQANSNSTVEHLTCSICVEVFIRARVLACEHTFCEYCITMWRKTQNICPICRAKIKTEPTRSIVLEDVCDSFMMNMPKEDQDRRAENIKLRQEELEKEKNSKPCNSRCANRGRGRGRRGRGGRGRANSRRSQNLISIEILSSSSDTDGGFDDLDFEFQQAEEFFDIANDYMSGYTGIPGHYYGGYGECYICHQEGHWSNGCPTRLFR